MLLDYAGYPGTVTKSIWANFKPNHPPPYKVGLAFAQLTADSQLRIYNTLKKELSSDPNIKLTAVTTGNQVNVPQQISQFNALINSKPDLLIIEPIAEAFAPQVDKAGKLGIPTISLQNSTDSKYAVNMQSNNYGTAAQSASVVFRQMGGKGNILYVHGIAATTVDQQRFAAFKAALKNCPGIKLAGEIAGAFVPPVAKSETLKYLATHPGRIDGVLQTGGMAPGIISAFKQSGRPVPIIDDAGAMKGSLGYWINNKDSYASFGEGFPPVTYGKSIASVTRRMLAGRGLKVSDVTAWFPPITVKSLDQWAQKDWDLNTPGIADGPPQSFMPETFISGLFNDPAPAAKGG